MSKRFKRLRFLFTFHKSMPFLVDFFRSDQIRRTTKLLYGVLIIGYIVMPLDLIPDLLYPLGFVDDITIAVFLLQRMVKKAPDDLKDKHRLE